jgi:hypothetical protein
VQIVAALFVEGMDMRQARPGGPTRIDLSGVMFSVDAPSAPPVTIAPHLVVLVRCPPDEPGSEPLETSFRWAATGEEVARNVQPATVEPGRFGRFLVRGELTFPDYGTIDAHVRLGQSAPVVVPLTLVPAPA